MVVFEKHFCTCTLYPLSVVSRYFIWPSKSGGKLHLGNGSLWGWYSHGTEYHEVHELVPIADFEIVSHILLLWMLHLSWINCAGLDSFLALCLCEKKQISCFLPYLKKRNLCRLNLKLQCQKLMSTDVWSASL